MHGEMNSLEGFAVTCYLLGLRHFPIEISIHESSHSRALLKIHMYKRMQQVTFYTVLVVLGCFWNDQRLQGHSSAPPLSCHFIVVQKVKWYL